MICETVRSRLSRLAPALALAAVLILAAFMSFFRLDQEGYGNTYYAAAVKSMMSSVHDFFFVSFDSGGFVSVDKPPLGLWAQVLSAEAFGFHGWALMLPQALAAVASVALVYYLVKRAFGNAAGLLAALIMAVTPIVVAASRNNTMDTQLVFTSLLAAWAVTLAAGKGKLRWLLACAFLAGLGFNIKMLQAFLVLPAFYLLYLVAAPHPIWKRIAPLGAASVVLAVVSLSWAIAVDLTPEDERPYVGSSDNNTVLELIAGHNGEARLGVLASLIGLDSGNRGPDDGPTGPGAPVAGAEGPPVGAPPLGGQQGTPGQPPAGPGSDAPRPLALGDAPQPPPGGGGRIGASETGEPGLLRLFNEQLAGQASWLLPLAALGLVVAAIQTRFERRLSREHQSLLLWGAWLLPQVVFFSYAGLFHRYYLEMMAPAIAALAAIGIVAMWKDYRGGSKRGWLLPLALAGTAGVEALILSDYPDYSAWLTPLALGATLAASAVLVFWRLARRPTAGPALPAAAAGVLALLVPLAVWAFFPVWHAGDAGLPYAGPDLAERKAAGPNVIPEDSELVEYLKEEQGDTGYLAATLNSRTAATLILATDEPVMALGGFSGSDHIVSPEDLESMVTAGEVRFFLFPTSAGPIGASAGRQPPRPAGQSGLTAWVSENCSSLGPVLEMGEPLELFDCSPTA